MECIRLRLEQNLPTPAIARHAGISNWSAYRILKAFPAYAPPQDRDTRRVARGKRWTARDLAFLKNRYPTASWSELHAGLPGRTAQQISKYANMQGLRRKPLVVRPVAHVVPALCAQLRRAREFQGLTRPQLSARGAGSVNSLCLWETGQREPNLSFMVAWAAALGLQLTLTPQGAAA